MMQTIGQAARQAVRDLTPAMSNGETRPARWSQGSLVKAENLLAQAFEQSAADEAGMYMAHWPTLVEMGQVGRNLPVAWLVDQLFSLGEFCGARQKMSAQQLEQTARLICQEYFYLKISELMLFFRRFKACRYGRFYGSVDPMVIMGALRDFMRERNDDIDRIEQGLRDELREINRRGAVSRDEYERSVAAGEEIPYHRDMTLKELINQKYELTKWEQ